MKLQDGYVFDNKGVMHRSCTGTHRLAGADLHRFRPLNHKFAIDSRHVYLHGRILKGALPASFRCLKDDYCADARSVFFGGRVIPRVNPEHFRVLGHGYAEDGRRVYFQGDLVKGAVPQDLQILNAVYAISRGKVFRFGKAVRSLDATMFTSWAGNGDSYKAYARIGDKILYDEKVVDGADAMSFAVLGPNHARDRGRVYFMGMVIEGADAATAQALSPGHLRDKHRVFWEREAIEDADAASFVANRFDDRFGCDDSGVYYLTYALDVKAGAYRFVGPAFVTSPATVCLLGNAGALAELSGIDATSLRQVGESGFYYRDKNNVWFVDLYRAGPATVVETADPESFEDLGFGMGRDTHQRFAFGKPFTPTVKSVNRSRSNEMLREAFEDLTDEGYSDAWVCGLRLGDRPRTLVLSRPVYGGIDSSEYLAEQDFCSLETLREAVQQAGEYIPGLMTEIELDETYDDLTSAQIVAQLQIFLRSLGYPLWQELAGLGGTQLYWCGFDKAALPGERNPARFWQMQEERGVRYAIRLVQAMMGPQAPWLNPGNARKIKSLHIHGDESRTLVINGSIEFPTEIASVAVQRAAARCSEETVPIVRLTARVLWRLRVAKEIQAVAQRGKPIAIGLDDAHAPQPLENYIDWAGRHIDVPLDEALTLPIS